MSLSHDTTTRQKSFGTFPRHLFERRCSHIRYFSYFQFHFLLKISRRLGSDRATLGLKRQRLRVATFYATMPTLCGSTSRTLYSCLSWHIVCLISSPSTFFQCPYYKLEGNFPPLGYLSAMKFGLNPMRRFFMAPSFTLPNKVERNRECRTQNVGHSKAGSTIVEQLLWRSNKIQPDLIKGCSHISARSLPFTIRHVCLLRHLSVS